MPLFHVRVTKTFTGVVPIIAETEEAALAWAAESNEVEMEIYSDGGVASVQVEITTDPPLNPDHMPYDLTPEA